MKGGLGEYWKGRGEGGYELTWVNGEGWDCGKEGALCWSQPPFQSQLVITGSNPGAYNRLISYTLHFWPNATVTCIANTIGVASDCASECRQKQISLSSADKILLNMVGCALRKTHVGSWAGH